ncbi:MAG: QueT transporter family protein [Lachnospiraceae bacterium]|nr:QueT transporter family protein [Lachnospiraceae bacterium]
MYRGRKVFIIQMIVIAVMYMLITVLENKFFGGKVDSGITKGIIQLRLADTLTVLPVFTPAAIPGLFLGCLATNKVIGCHNLDIIFGSLATLAGAIGTFAVRKKRFFAPIPPIVINMIVVPLMFTYVYRFDDRPFWQYVLFMGISGVISCGVLGIAFMLGLDDYKDKLFPPLSAKGAAAAAEKTEDNKEEDKTETTGDKDQNV